MKTALVITSAIIGMTLVGSAAAHHNCAAGETCPDEIGDVTGTHETTMDGDLMGTPTAAMDPADEDGSVPEGAGTWNGSDPTQAGTD
jgi:hypothetical protein